MANAAVLRALFRRFALLTPVALLAVLAAPALAHFDASTPDNIVSLHAEPHPLHQAVGEGDVLAANHFHFSPHNEDVNRADDYGDAPLHHAADSGSKDIVRWLVRFEASVNVQNKHEQETPLHRAAFKGYPDVVDYLLKEGADVNANGGDSPLHWAVYGGHTNIVSILLSNGADVNAQNPGGWTPLRHAARRPDSPVFAALLAAGGHYGQPCVDGFSVNPAGAEPPCICGAGRAEVNGKCLLEEEIANMQAELAALWVELISLNARLSVLATTSVSAAPPREDVEDMVERAELARRGIERLQENFIALTMTSLAAWKAPPVALSDTAAECRKLGGRVRIDSPTGMRVCLGVDMNDTFCLVYSDAAFPCRGLFRHVRQCNDDFNRPALNPFLCGARCGPGEVATGKECLP